MVGLDIGILVNNVGVGNSYPGMLLIYFPYDFLPVHEFINIFQTEIIVEYFHLIPDIDSFTNNMVHCNIISVTKMTAIVLGGIYSLSSFHLCYTFAKKIISN